MCCGIVGSALTCWVRLSTTWQEPESRMRRRRSFGPNRSRSGTISASRWGKNRYLFCCHPKREELTMSGFHVKHVLKLCASYWLVGLSLSNLVRRTNGTERWRDRRSSWSRELCTWRKPRACSALPRVRRKWAKKRRRAVVVDAWVLTLRANSSSDPWIALNTPVFKLVFFLSLSVRKGTWMSLSMTTLTRTCHWRRRRREGVEAAASRRRVRMERRRRGGGGESAVVNDNEVYFDRSAKSVDA